MVFNSYIFILAFLPIVIIGYYLVGQIKLPRLKHSYLLLVSIVFYGSSSIQCLILLLIDILINYFIYLCIRKSQSENETRKKFILILGISLNLALLFYFKYYNFFIDNMNVLFKANLGIRNIVLPLGISFITFQQIAFLTDTYHKETADCSLLEYALFVLFFPHITSGPIILHNDFMPWLNKHREKMNWEQFASGIYMFAMGLGKKVLIADMFAGAVNWGYGNVAALNSTSALFVSFAYCIQIYFDFSGYSDMAIGISRMLQMDLPVNFNSPYKAVTILEFWDRWHMTLTRFLGKYLYIPLGGNRKGKLRTYLNIMIVFLCSGLWHGASWTFILWGTLHGSFMILTKHFKKYVDKVPKIVSRIITLLFVNFCWILFRANSMENFRQMMKSIFQGNWGMLHEDLCGFFEISVLKYFPSLTLPYWLCAVTILTAGFWITLSCKNVQEKAENLKYSVASCIWTAIVVVFSILSLSGVSTYIYAYF